MSWVGFVNMVSIGPPGYDPAWDEVRGLHFDRQGQPLSLRMFALLCECDWYRRVAWTEVVEGVYVSTIWIAGPPIIGLFETMVGVRLDEPKEVAGHKYDVEWDEQYRWDTEAEAVAGHEDLVRRLSLRPDERLGSGDSK